MERAHSKSRVIIGLAVWIVITFVAAAVGGIASADAPGFYHKLIRPGWAPPGWIFAPVWTVLYLMMGTAAWLVWRERGLRNERTAVTLYLIQLAANALWTWIFFAWQQGAWAFYEILLLWALILATTIAFWRIRPLAGVLLIPYFAWATFACALTFAIWKLNPHLLG